jgi:hypothetical protein
MIGKLRLLFWLGIVMLFLPFLGIPNTWKMILAMLIGIGLIIIALLLRKKHRALRSVIRNLEHTITESTLHHE